MATNRSGVDSGIVGCGFHKSKSHRLMTQKYLTSANQARVVPRQGDLNGIGYYLDGKREYESIFGCMFDVCAQTDCPRIGQLAFDFIIARAELLGMNTFAYKIKKYHGPIHGRQGPWGRWNEVLEDEVPASGEDTYSVTVQRGAASSSNALEGGINKKMKIATGCSLPFSTLLLKALAMCSNLTNKLDFVGFSLFSNYMGDCQYVTHSKQSGRKSAQQTGKYPQHDIFAVTYC